MKRKPFYRILLKFKQSLQHHHLGCEYQLFKRLGWCLPIEGFAWSAIKRVRNCVEFSLGVSTNVGAFSRLLKSAPS